MEKAGEAASEAIIAYWHQHRLSGQILVLCGSGNNGGDGFVTARILKQKGYPVKTEFLGNQSSLAGDSKIAFQNYINLYGQPNPVQFDGNTALIVDALFGIGISRPIEGSEKDIIDQINAHVAPVISLDLPSGIDSDTGKKMGTAVIADMTLTFISYKPGLLMLDASDHTGMIDLKTLDCEL